MRRALAFLVFLLVPLGMGIFFGFYALERMRGTFEDEDSRLLQRKLDEVVTGNSFGFKIAEQSWRLISETRLLTGDNQFLLGERVRAADRLKCGIRLYLIQNGRIILQDGKYEDDDLMLKLGCAVFLPTVEIKERAIALDPELARRWKKNCSLEFFQKNNGNFLLTENAVGKPEVIFIEYRTDGLCLIVIFEGLETELIDELENRANENKDVELNVGTAVPELGIWHPPFGTDRLSMEKAFSLANLQAAPIMDLEASSWAFFKDHWGRVTALRVPKNRKGEIVLALRYLLTIGSLIIFIWGVIIYRKVQMGKLPLANSIRDQLRFLFIYVSILPLAGVLLLGWVSLRDQEDRLRHEGFRKGIERLQILIGGYFQERRNNLLQFRNFRNSLIFIKASEEVVASYAKYLDINRLVDYVVLLRPGNRTFSSFGPHQSSFVQALKSLGRIGLAKFAPHRLPQETQEPLNPIEMMGDDMVKSDEMGWSDLVQYRDRMHELRMARSSVDLYWDVYPEISTGTLFIALVQDHAKKLLNYFFQKIDSLKPFGGLFLMELKSGEFFPLGVNPDREKISDLLVLCSKKNQVIERELDLSSGTAWVVTMPDSFSNEVVFLAIENADQSLSRLRPFRIGLLIIFFLSIAVSLFAGSLLTSIILAPIQDLSNGMNAIRMRQTDFRVPVRRQDEFGELAALFNRMLSEFRELEIARIVQGQLLPRRIPEIPGYSLGARNIPATDLGGDYYDILALPGGKFLLLIGDATGHGVSAALAMAMAKATVAYQLSEGNFSPESMLDAINFVFFNELKAMRKFMTLLLVVLDPHLHSIEFWNAGHNFPILCSNSGEIFTPEMPNFPIGMRREFLKAAQKSEMKTRDVLVIFTDGYTESGVKTGGYIEYDGLNRIIRDGAQNASNAGEILNHCFRVFEDIRTPGPLSDDVTLVVIRRES